MRFREKKLSTTGKHSTRDQSPTRAVRWEIPFALAKLHNCRSSKVKVNRPERLGLIASPAKILVDILFGKYQPFNQKYKSMFRGLSSKSKKNTSNIWDCPLSPLSFPPTLPSYLLEYVKL
jgi:hypothetical protein